MDRLKLAMVGCGSAAERLHLPALAASPDFTTTVLVDRERDRAGALARRFEVPNVRIDVREITGHVDAAIVAVPNHLHGPVSEELLHSGVHVLVEKPMGLSVVECDGMIAAAESSGAVLSVGLVRRRYPAFRFTKALFHRGVLGRVKSFDFREGEVYGWDSASDGNFRKGSGGGVLTDLGSHLLDALGWWLGEPEVLEYRDDAVGGVEAECRIELALPCGASGVVELSRLRRLRNTYRIHAEHGSVEVGLGYDGAVGLTLDDGAPAMVARASPKDEIADLTALFGRQLGDFAAAIRNGSPPPISGQDGRRSVALIEACRDIRTVLTYPWDMDEVGSAHAS
jgi:predicted dehydrogenase